MNDRKIKRTLSVMAGFFNAPYLMIRVEIWCLYGRDRYGISTDQILRVKSAIKAMRY